MLNRARAKERSPPEGRGGWTARTERQSPQVTRAQRWGQREEKDRKEKGIKMWRGERTESGCGSGKASHSGER